MARALFVHSNGSPLGRDSPLKKAGSLGTNARIRPAVGDQRGGLTENSTKENDSDWIKIQEYVKTLSPRILGEAQNALHRKKWKGEGVVQEAFASSCVHEAKAITVLCSSKDVCASIARMLSLVTSSTNDTETKEEQHSISVGDFELRLEEMPRWAQRLRSMRSADLHLARIDALEFSAAADFEAELASRSLSSLPADNIQKTQAATEGSEETKEEEALLALEDFRTSGMTTMESFALALTKEVDVVPPRILVRTTKRTRTEEEQALEVEEEGKKGATVVSSNGDRYSSNGQQHEATARVKEVVLGASWEAHPNFERILDRLFGAAARVSPGVWQPPSGPCLRLIPTDESGFKTLILFSPDVEAVLARVKREGLSAKSFPGYWSLQVAGFDLRVTSNEDVEPFYDEVRWEVGGPEGEVEKLSSGSNANVSCVGAVTHGLYKGALTRKFRS